MENVRVCYCELSCEIKGFVAKRFEDGENYYTIYINSNVSEEKQQEPAHQPSIFNGLSH